MTARSMAEGRRIPAHPDDVRAGLSEAGQRLEAARLATEDALADIAAWLVAGREIEIDIAEMARLATISRPTVYKMLREELGIH